VLSRFYKTTFVQDNINSTQKQNKKNQEEKKKIQSNQRHNKTPPSPPIQIINEDWCLKHHPEP